MGLPSRGHGLPLEARGALRASQRQLGERSGFFSLFSKIHIYTVMFPGIAGYAEA
jgi:hypothetical protein